MAISSTVIAIMAAVAASILTFQGESDDIGSVIGLALAMFAGMLLGV